MPEALLCLAFFWADVIIIYMQRNVVASNVFALMTFSAPIAFIEMLRERMFKPSLSSIINENTKYGVLYFLPILVCSYVFVTRFFCLKVPYDECFRLATASPSDPVYVAAKKMREARVSSVLIMSGSRVQGILTYRLCLWICLLYTSPSPRD